MITFGIHMLGGQQQEKEEGQIRSSVAYKLDEGFSDEEAVVALGGDQVEQRKEGEEESNEHTGDKLAGPVAASPAWELIIPARREQLLTVWLCYKLTTE